MSLRRGRSHLAGVFAAICPFVWCHRLICAQQSGSGQPAAPEADLAAASDVKHTDQSLSNQHRWWWWRWRRIKLIFSSGEQLRSSAAVGGERTSLSTAQINAWNTTGARSGSPTGCVTSIPSAVSEAGGTFRRFLGQDTQGGEATPRLASASSTCSFRKRQSKFKLSIHILSLLLQPWVAGANPSHLTNNHSHSHSQLWLIFLGSQFVSRGLWE